MKFVYLLILVFSTLNAYAHNGVDHDRPLAIKACAEKEAGAACEFKGHGGNTINGVCQVGRPRRVLICKNLDNKDK